MNQLIVLAKDGNRVTVEQDTETDALYRSKGWTPAKAAADAGAPAGGGTSLRDDGPTIEEWVAAGYLPENYPPDGYAERRSDGLKAFKKNGKIPPALVEKARAELDARRQAEADAAAKAAADAAASAPPVDPGTPPGS